MKRLMLAQLALLVLLYPVSGWLVGRSVEGRVDDIYARAQDLPYLKVTAREHRRGTLTSDETTTLQIDLEALRPAGSGGEPIPPFDVTLHSTIHHGPLPRLSTVAAAVIETEILTPAQFPPAIAALFGDQPPLTAHTVLDFHGGSSSEIRSPGFSTTFDGGATSGEVRTDWGGLQVDLTTAPALDKYTLRGAVPSLRMSDDAGASLVLTGLNFDQERSRYFADSPFLFTGVLHFNLDELDIQGLRVATAPAQSRNLTIKRLSYELELPESGEFAEMRHQAKAATLNIDRSEWGPAELDVALEHIHARTLAKLIELRAPALLAGAPKAAEADEATPALIGELLERNPAVEVKRISVTTERGEVKANGQLTLNKDALQDWRRLDASADISTPEEVLVSGFPNPAQARAFLNLLVGQGYLSNNAGIVSTSIVARDGSLSFNGKVLDLSAFAPRTAQGS